tara:strand:+ start:724 stop:945 length:222 start_codon:yes stop_codon:yes gene_type:complete
MSKEEIKIKSNGLRNELKEIRKSIDKLTNAIIMAQTHKQHEKNYYTSFHPLDDGMRWTETNTNGGLQEVDEGH